MEIQAMVHRNLVLPVDHLDPALGHSSLHTGASPVFCPGYTRVIPAMRNSRVPRATSDAQSDTKKSEATH